MVIKLFVIFTSFQLFAQPVLVEKLSFKNDDCQETDSCNLKNFSLEIFDVDRSYVSDEGIEYKSIGSAMQGQYQTKKISQLRDFAVVQYIQGCVYQSRYTLDGELLDFRYNSRQRTSYGEKVNFHFPFQLIDSVDKDPIYYSFEKYQDRHGKYRVKYDEGISLIFGPATNYQYLFEGPVIKRPILHFGDISTGSTFKKTWHWINGRKTEVQVKETSSLAFETCIYKTADVPANLDPSMTDKALAIKCFRWMNSHLYDLKKQKHLKSSSIDPMCL